MYLFAKFNLLFKSVFFYLVLRLVKFNITILNKSELYVTCYNSIIYFSLFLSDGRSREEAHGFNVVLYVRLDL